MSDVQIEFMTELQNLLERYKAEISAGDHYRGYAECGQDIRIEVDFDNFNIPTLNLGAYIDPPTLRDQIKSMRKKPE